MALIAARSRPPLAVTVESVDVEGATVLVIQVPVQRQLVGTSDGVYVRRAIAGDGRPSCVPMDVCAMQSLQASRGLFDPSAVLEPSARWEDLDPLEFERFRRSVRERRGLSDKSVLELTDFELAKALGVVEANGTVRGVRVAAILLFGKDDALRRFMPGHEVAFQRLNGLDVEVNDFFRWPLLRVLEEIEARIRARNREQELMVGMLRVGVPDYPSRALREALANALIHRDYQRLGAVHFQWHANCIQISNPGGFPEGVGLDNLLVTAPRARNPLLVDAFKRAGIVERNARGIDTIFMDPLRNGRRAPSYAGSNTTDVVVEIAGGEANLELVRLLVTEARRGRMLGLDELLILDALVREGRLTTEDAVRLTQKPEFEVLPSLQLLVEAGLIEKRRHRKDRVWRLTATTCCALGMTAGSAHARKFELPQQEQVAMQFVEKHGRITRRDLAELCRISLPQAYRLLDRLVKQGVIARERARGRAVGYRKRTE